MSTLFREDAPNAKILSQLLTYSADSHLLSLKTWPFRLPGNMRQIHVERQPCPEGCIQSAAFIWPEGPGAREKASTAMAGMWQNGEPRKRYLPLFPFNHPTNGILKKTEGHVRVCEFYLFQATPFVYGPTVFWALKYGPCDKAPQSSRLGRDWSALLKRIRDSELTCGLQRAYP